MTVPCTRQGSPATVEVPGYVPLAIRNCKNLKKSFHITDSPVVFHIVVHLKMVCHRSDDTKLIIDSVSEINIVLNKLEEK